MMENRIAASLELMAHDGSFLCHIDENEYERLHLLCEQLDVPNAGTVVWDKRNPMNAGQGIANQHEYIVWRSRQKTPIYLRNDSILAMLDAAENIIKKHRGVT
jgi:adenine-specific DNA-methyltransferase